MSEPLVFLRGGNGWVGEGAVRRLDFPLEPGGIQSIRQRLAQARRDGESFVAFCAFPFSPDAPAGGTILVPERAVAIDGDAPTFGSAPLPAAILRDGRMSRAAYTAAVAATAAAIRDDRFEKAVIARDVVLEPVGELDAGALVDALRAANPTANVFAVDGLIGASPETLVTVHDGVVTARVLAGTAAPGEGEALYASPKDRREHRLALASVLDALAPHVVELEDSGAFVLEQPRLVHLATDVTARISDRSDVLALVAALHPTAAVAGTPRAAALDWIRRVEPGDRGRYAGPVGWIDGDGNGEFAIALRAAQLEPGGTLRAFAGAGIMADSSPEAELTETDLKLRPILDAFGVAAG